MAELKAWQELKAELARETKKVFAECPDEVKRYHYGIITHSDAGKHALNQYFGHWVHAYGHFMMYSGDMLSSIRHLARDPDFELKHLKKMFIDISRPPGTGNLLVLYGGQKSLGKYIDKTIAALDSLETKQEFLELLQSFQAYASRIYWWFHWYFPWGIGPVLCRRLDVEDVKEMARLAGLEVKKP